MKTTTIIPESHIAIKDVKVPFKMSGGERVDDTPVHKAIREALANCLINADYHGLRGVVIRKESDKLVLANPGYIRTVLSLSFLKKEDAKMKEDTNLIQKNERSLKEVLKEVLNQKDYEKTLPIIEYLETNSSITTQTVRRITGKSLATAWRYIQILVKADVLESDGNTNNAE